MKPSKYQQAILAALQARQTIQVNAVAGSGKTSTLLLAASELDPNNGCFVAFNKAIADEISQQLKTAGNRLQARTGHALGLALVREALDRKPLKVEGRKYAWLAEDYLKADATLTRAYGGEWEARRVLTDCVKTAQKTLLDPASPAFIQALDADGIDPVPGLQSATTAILKQGALAAQRRGLIDFDDMLALPARWNLKPAIPFEHLFADEVQDLSPALRDCILRHCDGNTQALAVGDPKQSIFGFAGASTDSFGLVREALKATELPLSICYRCPPNHLELVRGWVPQIEAVPARPDGILEVLATRAEILARVAVGDLILSRRTAPLITLAAQLIGAGIGARIKGTDYAKSLLGQLRKLAKGGHNLSKAELATNLATWEREQATQLEARDASASAWERLTGTVEALTALIEATPGPDYEAVRSYTEGLFSDGKPQVVLSTIHRAKGLENPRVFVLEFDKLGQGFPRQSPEEREQEQNLRYVALTRATEALFLVRE